MLVLHDVLNKYNIFNIDSSSKSFRIFVNIESCSFVQYNFFVDCTRSLLEFCKGFFKTFMYTMFQRVKCIMNFIIFFK